MAGKKQPMPTSPAATAGLRQAAAAAPVAAAGEAVEAARQKAAAFKQKHAEFRAEAAALAADFGVDVNAIVFLPDGVGGALRAVNDFFPGDAEAAAAREHAAEVREARMGVMDLLRKDVNQMNLEEAKAHDKRLLELRAALERRLQENRAATASGASAADGPKKKMRREE